MSRKFTIFDFRSLNGSSILILPSDCILTWRFTIARFIGRVSCYVSYIPGIRCKYLLRSRFLRRNLRQFNIFCFSSIGVLRARQHLIVFVHECNRVGTCCRCIARCISRRSGHRHRLVVPACEGVSVFVVRRLHRCLSCVYRRFVVVHHAVL